MKDIGRTTSGPEINIATGEVSITYLSSTKCATDPAQNYKSTIVFTCQRGLELVSQHLYDLHLRPSRASLSQSFSCSDSNMFFLQGSPQMLRLQGCVYLFEWATPVVCSDATNTSGCKLTDTQLQYTFDLTALSTEVQVSSSELHVCPRTICLVHLFLQLQSFQGCLGFFFLTISSRLSL